MTTPIPQPPGWPIVGNVFDVDPNNAWPSIQALAEKYGEIFQIKILGKPLVFVASAALAEELCDEKRFRKFVGGPIVEIRYAVHNSLFTAYNDEESWGVAHRIIAPMLSPASVALMFDEMNDCASRLTATWTALGPDGASNEVCAVGGLNRLNLEATTLTLFGKRLDCLSGPEHPMIQAMEDATSEAMKRPTRFPKFLNWLVYGSKFKSSTRVMRTTYAADLVAYRKAHPVPDRRDVLWALMNGTDPDTAKGLTESEVIDEIVTMPIGSSTAPALVATAMLFMRQNPAVIDKAREELDALIGDGPFTHAHLAQMPYTEGILRESLRLSFAAPGFNIEPIPSKSTSPVLLAGGKYQVAHNQAMLVVLAGANRDPAVFEEPLAFRPERMVGEAFERLPPGAKKWFGNGKRECIGKHWAWQFSLVALVRVLTDVDFELADPDYHLTQDGWFNLRPVNFFVKVRPRRERS